MQENKLEKNRSETPEETLARDLEEKLQSEEARVRREMEDAVADAEQNAEEEANADAEGKRGRITLGIKLGMLAVLTVIAVSIVAADHMGTQRLTEDQGVLEARSIEESDRAVDMARSAADGSDEDSAEEEQNLSYVIRVAPGEDAKEKEREAWDYFATHVVPKRYGWEVEDGEDFVFVQVNFVDEVSCFMYKFKEQDYFVEVIKTSKTDVSSEGVSGGASDPSVRTVTVLGQERTFHRYKTVNDEDCYIMVVETPDVVMTVRGYMSPADFVEISQRLKVLK